VASESTIAMIQNRLEEYRIAATGENMSDKLTS